MKQGGLFFSLIVLFLSLCGGGCIHEYPTLNSGYPQPPGNDPTSTSASLTVSYDLNWEQMIHHVDFKAETRARKERPHRFILEVTDGYESVCRDIVYLSDEEFGAGSFSHTLSAKLNAKGYNVGIWYDSSDDNGEYNFDFNFPGQLTQKNFSTVNAEEYICAFASDILDLRDLDLESEKEIRKEVILNHPGARFEIVSTDIQQFITDNKAALNQGDKYSVELTIYDGSSSGFDIYRGERIKDNIALEYSGRMRLPFDDYEELKIAEGFVFCNEEEEITARLKVINSALMTVSQTKVFTFPVKRGYITTVSGDFLTNPIDGIFTINNIWDGEIIIEI